jgi:hypothetical protein
LEDDVMAEKRLPPDAPLVALASLINGHLAPLSASVNFFRIEHSDGGGMQTGIIYQCGPRRAVVITRAYLGEGDADEIVRGVTEWVADIRPESKWTADPKEAA